ncbi:competence protein ComK [Alkalihalobacillus hwajinpoensis]|uniref:competence protein ComK n=1 Tax=Guptibacillus hwajinpoensis TaxID=208199 RepID=UPI0018844758|nr:competence protein ComK [Pseudalkalibacillus hwajinpoensis]MBF0707843.1 competence protein ComK [Pseudalkalibacillus hwajinpoensis]
MNLIPDLKGRKGKVGMVNNEVEILNDYEISKTTRAIVVAKEVGFSSRIYDRCGIYLSTTNPVDLIRQACLEAGVTYEGRRKAVIYHLKYEQQTPIIVSNWNAISVFPTESPESIDCCWVFYQHVRDVYAITKSTTMILFQDGFELLVPVSKGRLQKQMERMGRWISHYSNNPVYC